MKRLHSVFPCFLLICLLACNQNNIPESNELAPTIPPATEPRPTVTLIRPTATLRPTVTARKEPKTLEQLDESDREEEPEPVAVATMDTVEPEESTPLLYSPIPGQVPSEFRPPVEEASEPILSSLTDVDPSNQQITLWHEYSPELEYTLLELVTEFNLANDYNITVIAEQMGEHSTLYNQMLAAITQQERPDLLITTSHDMVAYQNNATLVDLTLYMEDMIWGLTSEERNDYQETTLASDYNSFFGQQLGFPISRSMDVLYINLDLLRNLGFDQLPTTWESFATMACSARNAGYIGYEFTTDARPLIAMVLSRGGHLIAEDYSTYAFHESDTIEVMTWLDGLYQEECAVLQSEPNRKWERFSEGQVLFTIDHSDSLPIYQSAVAQGYQGVWSIAPLPYDGPAPIMNTYGKSFSLVKNEPESELAAWLFVKWYTDTTQQARWIERAHTLPVRQSVNDQLGAYLAQHPTYQISLDLQQYSQFETPIINYPIVHELLTEVMIEILQGAHLTETLNDLNDEANYMLEDGN